MYEVIYGAYDETNTRYELKVSGPDLDVIDKICGNWFDMNRFVFAIRSINTIKTGA